jgi:chorismate mutase
MPCECRVQRRARESSSSTEPEIVKKLLTLGYQYVKLIASNTVELENSLHRSIRLLFCQRALSSWVE